MSDTADLGGGESAAPAPSSTALAAQEGASADTDERLQEAGADGQEGGLEEQPAAEYYSLVIDGEEVEMTLEEMKSSVSLNRASQKRMREAAEQRKENEKTKEQIQNFVKQMKSGNPEVVEALLRRIGADPVAISEHILRKQLEELDMPADKRGMREVERERERLRRERAEWDQQRGEVSLEAETEKHLQRYQQEVRSELSAVGLPPNPTIIGKVAAEISSALQAGHDLTTAEAVALVMEDMRAAARRLPPDALRRLMGDAPAADSLRRGEAQRVSTEQKRQRAAPAKAAPAAPVKRMRVDPEDGDALKALFDS